MLLANTLAPWLPFTPGFSAFAVELVVPMTVLAAVIERPFLSAAGVRRNALARSVQANTVSTLLGVLTVLPATVLAYTVGPWVWLLAIGLSILVERGYLRRSGPKEDRAVRLSMFALGNLVSAAVLWSVPFVVFAIQDAVPEVRPRFAPYETWLRWIAVGATAVAIIWAFIAPSARTPTASATPPAPRSTQTEAAIPASTM